VLVPVVDLSHVRPRERCGDDADPVVAVIVKMARRGISGPGAVEEEDLARPRASYVVRRRSVPAPRTSSPPMNPQTTST
jgi:hypothetical protein